MFFSISFSLALITAQEKFPSPYGDMFFSIKNMTRGKRINGSFRPLTGICFSQFIVDKSTLASAQVSVPLRGYVFLNPVPANHWAQRAPAAVCGADRRWVLP